SPLAGGISYTRDSKDRAQHVGRDPNLREAMQLTQSMGMRMEQRQLLTPRMIQSMEILQLPLMALEERIEQELQNNPVLELREGAEEGDGEVAEAAWPSEGEVNEKQFSEEEKPMVEKEGTDQADEIERLARV